jgi:hypothetical protein
VEVAARGDLGRPSQRLTGQADSAGSAPVLHAAERMNPLLAEAIAGATRGAGAEHRVIRLAGWLSDIVPHAAYGLVAAATLELIDP